MRYTSIVDISDLKKTWGNFEKRTKYEIRKCSQKVKIKDDIIRFDELHYLSRPDRVISSGWLHSLYNSLWADNRAAIYLTETAGALISWDKEKKIGYYLLAGRDKTKKADGSPSKIIWQAMKDLNKMGIKKFNLCGYNKPNIQLFKRGFGGEIVEQETPCVSY